MTPDPEIRWQEAPRRTWPPAACPARMGSDRLALAAGSRGLDAQQPILPDAEKMPAGEHDPGVGRDPVSEPTQERGREPAADSRTPGASR